MKFHTSVASIASHDDVIDSIDVICSIYVFVSYVLNMAPKYKELSSEVREMIVKSYQSNQNMSELSEMLGIPRSTFKSVIGKYKQFGSVENRSGRGKKKLFTDRDVTKLSRILKANRKKSLQDVTNLMNEGMDHTFCTKTIERKIHTLGFKRRAVKKRMVVQEGSRINRVKWCRER